MYTLLKNITTNTKVRVPQEDSRVISTSRL